MVSLAVWRNRVLYRPFWRNRITEQVMIFHLGMSEHELVYECSRHVASVSAADLSAPKLLDLCGSKASRRLKLMVIFER